MAGTTKAKLKAVKIGPGGPSVVMTEEDAQAYLLLLEGLLAELQPEGAEEEELVRQITDCSWRLLRIQNIAQTLRGLSKPELEPAIEKAGQEERRFAKRLLSLERQFARLRDKRRDRQIAEALEKPGQSSLVH